MMLQFKKMIKSCLLIALLWLLTTTVKSQDSMMPDVSNSFLNKLIDTAKKYYPRVRSFDHRLNISMDNIKKAQLAWFDLFTFSYLYSPNNSSTLVNPSTLNGYQFGIFFNISTLLTKPHNIKQAREELVITKLQQEEYILNITAEVKSRYYKYIQNVTLLRLRTMAAVDAENVMKQLKYKFEKSEETFEDYNRAVTSYNDRRQSIIQSEADVLVSKSFLEEMLGKKLEEINP
jgi:outer membrane protein TolC